MIFFCFAATVLMFYGVLVIGACLTLLWRWLVKRLAWRMFWEVLDRDPNLVIGDEANPYLKRWELARFLGCQLALHQILRSDDDRAPHDHVSWHASLILVTGYLEHIKGEIRWRRPGQIIFRKALTPHRLELQANDHGPRSCLTLWLRGPKWRDWGFYCKHGWVQWEEFGRRGCD